jgi:FKBP-type peptidyl-prolyl cis-trans isomerase (trigger factor)
MFKKAAQPSQKNPQTTIIETAPCQKSLRLHVASEAIAPVRGAVLAEFQKRLTLPGFRKGRAPADLVERQYAKDIQEETLHRVTTQALEQAAQDHHLKPVGPFEVRAANFSEAGGVTLEATVEVEPSFTLGSYKGIALTQQPIDVTPQDVEKALAALQESMAQLVPVGEGGAKERRLPPIDHELAKDLGFENLEKLREHVEVKLREQQRAAQAERTESALCEELLKRHAFEVPPRLVSHQTERLTRDFRVRLLLSGMPEEQVHEKAEQFTEQLRTSATRHVKLSFILERIAAQESVSVSQDELVGRLWQLAQRWKKDPAEVRKTFDAQGLWPSVVSTIRQEKTTALLLSAASITNGPAERQTRTP